MIAPAARLWVISLCLLGHALCTEAADGGSDMLSTLRTAEGMVNLQLEGIAARWEVDRFPVFLKTQWMLEPAYALFKQRLHTKIAKSLQFQMQNKSQLKSDGNTIPSLSGETFIVTFTGSSVTAGHDSPFILSFPVLAGNLMQPAFSALGIELTVRNAGMGNNPCMPYDVCVRTFAGADADVVVWEQSYNCQASNKGYLYEQFIRQV
jgi:hypothetical protein